MVLQKFKCRAGHSFERFVRYDLSDEPTRCPVLLDENDPKSDCWASVLRISPTPVYIGSH